MTIGPDSKVLEANEALCDIVDYAQADIVSRLFLDLILPDDHKIVVNAFIDVFYGFNGPKKYNFRLLSASGTPIATSAIFSLNDVELTPSAHIQLSLASEHTSGND